MNTSSYIIAFDAGGSSVKSARVSLQHGVIDGPRNDAIDSLASKEIIVGGFAHLIEAHIEEAALDPAGVAFSFPGPFDYENGICLIQHASHSAGVKYGALFDVNVRDAIREKLNRPALPIAFRNDGEAAILGEARYGAGMGIHRLIGITLGTGLGSAFLVDGTAQTQGDGVPANGWLYCIPHENETADDHFSTRGLLARFVAAGRSYNSIEEASHADDILTKQCFESWGADLGTFLKTFVVDFKADAVIALGGITRAWARFGPALQQALPAPAKRGTLDQNAALLGAADLLR